MFKVCSGLVHTRLQRLANVLNSVWYGLLQETVPDLLLRGSKFRDRYWLFIQLRIGI